MLRRYLVSDRGFDRQRITFAGYRRHGRTEDDTYAAVIKPDPRGIRSPRATLSISRWFGLLLIDPAAVILDEATAEVGSDAARLLDATAARVLAGRSGFVIGHRLSQATTPGTIMVIEAGTVVESGTHDELLQFPRTRLWSTATARLHRGR